MDGLEEVLTLAPTANYYEPGMRRRSPRFNAIALQDTATLAAIRYYYRTTRVKSRVPGRPGRGIGGTTRPEEAAGANRSQRAA